MPTQKKNRTAKKAPAPSQPAPAPAQEQAFLQAALYENAMAEISNMRDRLLAGDCPATIPVGERQAAAIDLARALAQLTNLQRHYWKGGAP